MSADSASALASSSTSTDSEGSGLLMFGSRANYQILLKVREDGVESLTRDIRRGFRDRFVNARGTVRRKIKIGENLQRAENFLSLVGFVIVVLGGIGVWSVTRVFVRQKIRSVAILKCVGASTAQVLATYVLQVGLLALAGSLHRRRPCRRRHAGDPRVPRDLVRRLVVRA